MIGRESRESLRKKPTAGRVKRETRVAFAFFGDWCAGLTDVKRHVHLEFPKASRLFHRSSRRGADFFPRSSAVVASAEAPRRRRRRRIPRAERGDTSKDIARDGFGRVTGARRFECVDRGAFATRSRGGGMAPFFRASRSARKPASRGIRTGRAARRRRRSRWCRGRCRWRDRQP